MVLRGIKQRLSEAKEKRRLQQEEDARQRAQQQQQMLEEERQQRELQQKILAMLGEGKIPDLRVSVDAPFRLLKGERYLLAIEGVNYSEIRTKREIVGRSAGTSVRVMKGV